MTDQKRNITETVATYSSRLFQFIRNRVSSNEDAEDILQDVFFQLAGNTEPIMQMSSWLFAIARNKITDNYRKKKTDFLEELFVSEEEDEVSWEEIIFSEDGNNETIYLRNLFWEALYESLEELSPEQRDAFVLHEIEDKSFEEISAATGIGVPTLISRKRYAVLHLRERLKQLKDELLNF